MIKIFGIIEILLTIILIVMLFYFFQQEQKGHKEMMSVLNEIRDNTKK